MNEMFDNPKKMAAWAGWVNFNQSVQIRASAMLIPNFHSHSYWGTESGAKRAAELHFHLMKAKNAAIISNYPLTFRKFRLKTQTEG